MEASGKKDFDIKVVMDPGLYPHEGHRMKQPIRSLKTIIYLSDGHFLTGLQIMTGKSMPK
jgi:hypothetical protein